MAWRRGKDKKQEGPTTPEEELDAYKKEIGKQYMDGLISDKEYEDLLFNKTRELGLDAGPAAQEEATKGPECPMCGAHVDPRDTTCNICGAKLEPKIVLESAPPAPEMPQEEAGRICSLCGSSVSKLDTICNMCGGTLIAEDVLEEQPLEPELPEEVPPTQDAPEEPVPEEAPPEEERVCPACGAYVDADATECMICDAPIAVAPAPETAEVPLEATTEPEEPLPEEAPPEEERVCPACGAYVDADATECMICDAPITVAPETAEAPEEPVPEEAPPEEERVCPACGAFADSDSTVCIICETPLAGAEPMPTHEDIELPPEEAVEPEAPAEPGDNDIICPSCSKTIPADSGTCPECWTDLSLYVRCPSCSLLSLAGEKLCRECFAPLAGIEEPEPSTEFGAEEAYVLKDIDIPDDIEISEELREEMTVIETQEEQGKECLVCGAIFGPEDQLCPICGIEYGVEIEEPEAPETVWELKEVEVHPTIHTCPNCGKNAVGLDATDREVNEGKWFYRGLVTIFTGIFFSSFSIWARGISAENASLGLRPPPTDVVLNAVGGLLVLVGFAFWLLSWRMHGQRTECYECGVETEPDMEKCINCGTDLGLEPEDEPEPEDQVDEELLPKEDTNYLDTLNLPRRGYAPEAEEPQPDFGEMPETEETPPQLEPDDTQLDLGEIPEAEESAPPEEPDILDQPISLEEPEMPEPAEAPVAPEPEHFVGEELPVEHEEHKKCPGCGIFVDLNERVCPVCDTEFSVEPAPEVPSEDEEIAGLEPEATIEPAAGEPVAEPTMDDITLPDSSSPHLECPSCGADLEAGTKICPVCEYPLV